MVMEDESDGDWIWRIAGFSIRSEHIPIIVGVITSSALVLLLVVAYLLWKCFIADDDKPDKASDVVNVEPAEKNTSNNASYSTIVLDGTNGRYLCTSRIVELIPEQENIQSYWLYRNHVLEVPQLLRVDTQTHSINTVDSLRNLSCRRLSDQSVMSSPVVSLEDCSLPQISEFSAHPCHYLSNSLLDGCYVYEDGRSFSNLRTRSLPSCVRAKKRPLSSIENPAEIYDKVNFSKKRRNRMRNDEAAIIALSKSRSEFFMNKDTDILVDNEAVIVYDERTAL